MKMLWKTLLILLMLLCIFASAQIVNGAEKPQNVGGNFGRAWLEDNLAPKGNATTGDDLNRSAADPLGIDWLALTAPLRAENDAKKKSLSEAGQEIPFSISKTMAPIHQIDASWNQTLLLPKLPQPDKNGLINGIPAETYYAIGPAYFNF